MNLLLKMLAKFLFHFFIELIATKEGAHAPWQRVEPLFDAHVYTSLSFRIPEMADETRFQSRTLPRAVSFPVASANNTWSDGCFHWTSTPSESNRDAPVCGAPGRESRR